MHRCFWLLIILFVGGGGVYADSLHTDSPHITPPAVASLMVEHAWVRMPPPVADTAAAYMVLHNHSKHLVTITSITTDVAEKCEVHDMVTDHGMMHMRAVNKLEIVAGESLRLAPSGMHLMLTGLRSKLDAGQEIEFQFHLANREVITVSTVVKDMRQDAGIKHQHQH